ncbi:MAG: HEAT repeat domain-containing protein [Chthonomonas sp.]|nr:HEAT repeat domain-containing protein [Chthonomonas sp.]
MASRLDDVRDLRNATTDGALFNAFATLTGGAIVTSLIKHIATTDRDADYWIALVTSVPSMLGLLGIAGAIYGRQFPVFRRVIVPFGWIIRLALFPLLGLAIWQGPPEVRLPLLFLCVVVSGAAGQFVGPIYNDWMAELVPTNSRGWYFSRRNSISSLVGASTGLLGGFLIDRFRAQNQMELGYGLVLGLGIVFALLSQYFFLQMKEHVRPNPVKSSFREGVRSIRAPFRDKHFRKVLGFLAFFVFAQAFPGSILSPYALESLKLPLATIQFFGLVQAATIVLFAKTWGFLADKYGNKPILSVLSVGLGFTLLGWVFAGPDNPYNFPILFASHVVGGIVWAGIGTCQFNLLLATASPEDRANYMGSALAIQAVLGGVAPFLGMLLFRQFVGGGDVAGSYQTVLWIAIGIRFSSVFLLLPVREEGSTTIGQTLSQLKNISPTGYRALRDLSTSTDVSKREHAMEQLADKQFGVATDELIKALHDPSPRVRRKAAQALASLGDEKAVRALIHQLEDHADLVEDETIEALGKIGHPEAASILIRFLDSPRSQLRRAAAKALGELGLPEVIPALIRAARDPHDPDLRRAALQGLRWNMGPEAVEVVAESALDPRPSVRIAAAEAISEHELRECAVALRQSAGMHRDEACSEIAYALGAVGNPQDVPLILSVAQSCESVITRRRCLLGVARQWGIESPVYRLFLLSGMSRDSMLLDRVRPVLRRSKKLQTALARYSAGNEIGALEILSESKVDPRLAVFAEFPIEDGFLLAAEAYVQASAQPTRRGKPPLPNGP